MMEPAPILISLLGFAWNSTHPTVPSSQTLHGARHAVYLFSLRILTTISSLNDLPPLSSYLLLYSRAPLITISFHPMFALTPAET
jgi:hypothetical protein